jgi:hypothetical protein
MRFQVSSRREAPQYVAGRFDRQERWAQPPVSSRREAPQYVAGRLDRQERWAQP